MFRSLIPAAALMALAGSANAAMLSFASSTADHAWTFTGNGATVSNATGTNDYVTLEIDDNNGPLPVISVSTRFVAQYSLSYIGSLALGGGNFSHNYLGTGSYSFQDVASGVTILTVNFSGALFTARGGESSWYTTAALQGDNNGGSTAVFNWSGASLPGYGLTPGAFTGSFAFDHSALNSSGALPYAGQAPGRTLNAGHLPSGQWWSESSYSALTDVPAPGSFALLGLAGLAAARRRR